MIWCVGMVLVVWSGMQKYGAMSGEAGSLNAVMQDLPRSLKAILGMGPFDLSTLAGYYGVLFVYIALMAAIHAVMLGADMLAKEERDHTVEFLLAKPLSRVSIVTCKLAAAAAGALVLNLVTLGTSLAVMIHYDGKSLVGKLTVLLVGLFMLQLMFLLLGAGLAAISRRPKSAGSVAASLMLLLYLLSLMVDFSDKLAFLQVVTPFKYFAAEKVLTGQGANPLFWLLSVVIVAVLLTVTYRSYMRRDMQG
jgi:ABC-2 type transport system permease protein